MITELQNIPFTVTRHPKDNKSLATSALVLIKKIAKLERTQSNALQNKDQHRTPTGSGDRAQKRKLITYYFGYFKVPM